MARNPDRLIDITLNEYPAHLIGPLKILFEARGRALDGKPQEAHRVAVAAAHAVAEAARPLWDCETDVPAYLTGASAVPPVWASEKYAVTLVPLLPSLRDLGARTAAVERLSFAACDVDPHARARTLPWLRWALTPALREIHASRTSSVRVDEDPVLRGQVRDLYRPFLGPYLAGALWTKNLKDFSSYQELDDLDQVVIDTIANYDGISLDTGIGKAHRQTVEALASAGWVRLEVCDSCYRISRPHRRHEAAYPTGRIRNVAREERYAALG